MVVRFSDEFNKWFNGLSINARAEVEVRILRIKNSDYFGNFKSLGSGLLELKWRSGRRIYFMRVDARTVLLLIGGDKNGQKKDIKKARSLLRRDAHC